MCKNTKDYSLDELFELLRSKLKELENIDSGTSTLKQRVELLTQLEIIEKAIDEKRSQQQIN